jgi:hypothetical protein
MLAQVFAEGWEVVFAEGLEAAFEQRPGDIIVLRLFLGGHDVGMEGEVVAFEVDDVVAAEGRVAPEDAVEAAGGAVEELEEAIDEDLAVLAVFGIEVFEGVFGFFLGIGVVDGFEGADAAVAEGAVAVVEVVEEAADGDGGVGVLLVGVGECHGDGSHGCGVWKEHLNWKSHRPVLVSKS